MQAIQQYHHIYVLWGENQLHSSSSHNKNYPMIVARREVGRGMGEKSKGGYSQ